MSRKRGRKTSLFFMRYYNEKPIAYQSMFGELYVCDHPIYSRCTLYKVNKRGLGIIQQRFDSDTKSTYWGDLTKEDKDLNEEALKTGGRLFSSYKILPKDLMVDGIDDRLWIITEADRSVTTILFPSDY